VRSTQHVHQTLNRVDCPTFTPSQTPFVKHATNEERGRQKNPTWNSTTTMGSRVSINMSMGRKNTRQTRSGKKSSQTNVPQPTKRKSNMTEDQPLRKCLRTATPVCEKESESSSGDDNEEFDDAPLTKANIPKIVEAVLNNIPNRSEATQEEQDNPHLGEYNLAPFVSRGIRRNSLAVGRQK